ncbi:hypothetical protein [Gaoshiqia sediminis]|uniref:YXWGXW repeat-containing protein n=1 Tax=Gaoshiqia sediminis TaxID=2986998 RepID=A0AA42C4Q2_9BACT|nr:hypothetical protein [Gaoshiqia sediminis]MCW0482013.1 hypothetical protein [Gaoshiqia sediminis]
MKRKLLILIAAIAMIAFRNTEANAQVVVPEKPVPPNVQMQTPPKPSSAHVLIPGHWVWSRKQKVYLWVVSTWIPEKEGHKWVSGYWKELPKGWKWVPGHWEKIDKRRYFFKL